MRGHSTFLKLATYLVRQTSVFSMADILKTFYFWGKCLLILELFWAVKDGKTYVVVSDNLEFRRGRKDGGWYLMCESNVIRDVLEAYSIQLANELIGETKQVEGVEVIKEDRV